MTLSFRRIFVLILLFGCWACGEKTIQSADAAEKAPVAAVDPLGEKVFANNCMVCHMQNGMGVPGLNPPLSKTEWVNGDKERLIKIVLNGKSDPIEINGETYQGVMASHAHLSDEEIAAVLSYVRSNFGNQSGPITPQEVAAVRANNTTE